MIYDIIHRTTYKYDAPVAAARCIMRLLPRNDCGQRVLSSHIHLAPDAKFARDKIDFNGNRVSEAQLLNPHTKLQITLAARVEVARTLPLAPALTPGWEDVRKAASMTNSLASASPAHFIYSSRFVPLFDAATDYARESFPSRRPILEGAVDLMRRIHADFTYDPDATHMATPIEQALAHRRGVCQDFAHIMIAALRGLGLPACYVSGYLRTIPAPGQPRLEGADATHAWISVWCGAECGWFDLDPTNAMTVGDDHIVIAIGRDYADVSPIDGVILATGGQELDVSVDVREVAI